MIASDKLSKEISKGLIIDHQKMDSVLVGHFHPVLLMQRPLRPIQVKSPIKL